MCWVQRIDSAPAIELGAVMDAFQYSVAIVYYQDKNGPIFKPDDLRAWIAAMKAQDFLVFGSVWLPEVGPVSGVEFDPATSAGNVYQDILHYRFDGFVANGEKRTEEITGYSGRFVKALRGYIAGVPEHYPLGWSPEPRLALDHDAFREHQVCYMPQAYVRENGYSLAMAMEVAKDFGYDPAGCKPLVGFHERAIGDLDPVWVASSAAAAAHRYGCLSPVMYPAEQTVFRPPLWKALAE